MKVIKNILSPQWYIYPNPSLTTFFCHLYAPDPPSPPQLSKRKKNTKDVVYVQSAIRGVLLECFRMKKTPLTSSRKIRSKCELFSWKLRCYRTRELARALIRTDTDTTQPYIATATVIKHKKMGRSSFIILNTKFITHWRSRSHLFHANSPAVRTSGFDLLSRSSVTNILDRLPASIRSKWVGDPDY